MPPEVQIDPGRRQPGEWQRFSSMATRDVAPDRVKTPARWLSQPFRDPALLEELKKRRWVVDSIAGELGQLAKEVISQPPRVVERMKKLLGN